MLYSIHRTQTFSLFVFQRIIIIPRSAHRTLNGKDVDGIIIKMWKVGLRKRKLLCSPFPVRSAAIFAANEEYPQMSGRTNVYLPQGKLATYLFAWFWHSKTSDGISRIRNANFKVRKCRTKRDSLDQSSSFRSYQPSRRSNFYFWFQNFVNENLHGRSWGRLPNANFYSYSVQSPPTQQICILFLLSTS